jgi:peptidyl-dipeptidase Dcp
MTTQIPPRTTPPPAPSNPLLEDWSGRFEMPPFSAIDAAHFPPAFDQAMAQALADIDAIANRPEVPSFDNTIVAMEQSGRLLDRVASVFFNLSGAHTNEALQAVERTVGPQLTAHHMQIYQRPDLFARVDALFQKRATLALTGEQERVLERYHRAFVKAGARLDDAGRKRLSAIAAELSGLAIKFNQNVLADEQSWLLLLDGPADLVGLPESWIAAAAETARDRGQAGHYALTLSRSSIEPFLQYSDRRDLREKAYAAWIARGANGGPHDNRAVMARIVALRAESASLLGFANHAVSSLEFTMAKTPQAVRDLLMTVWAPARARAGEEREALAEAARGEGGNFEIAAWDWRYYSEKVRKARFDIDEREVKSYLQLDNVIAAAFDCATRLFGVTFREVHGLALYHPDVRGWEVVRDGQHVALFLGDYFARPSKRSGAWMSSYRDQHKLENVTAGGVHPIVVNVMNFTKAPDGQPTLLSMDDARTLFHEFGHGLHGILSNVTYPSVSGTSVPRDFVELPSQLYEHWLQQPQVLRQFARHVATGAAMPDALIERVKAARTFNAGFSTVEYLASAIVDMDLHTLTDARDDLDVDAFERAALAKIGMPAEISMRHRIPHFQHITGGYAAGYYSYLWSEVLDADAFAAFEEANDIFDPAIARRLHDHIYASGGRTEADAAYRAFRGRMPTVDALLRKRGFPDGGAPRST